MIILETKEDMAKLVTDWRDSIIMHLQDIDNIYDCTPYDVVDHVIELLSDLPFTNQFFIDEGVMEDLC